MIELFSKSEKFTEEYCIPVVTIGVFRNRELKAIDAGEVDIEMQESYS